MKLDLDYITLIVNKKVESSKIEGGEYLGNVFLLHFTNEINIKLEKNQWASNISTAPGIYTKETKHNHQIQFSGEFFLKRNYKEILSKAINYLINKEYDYHFTRVDVSLTLQQKMETALSLMIDNSNFEEVVFKKKGVETYHSYHNSRFALVIYNKKLHLEKMKRSNPSYIKSFQEKYYSIKEHEITRIECRLKGKDTLFLLKIVKNADEFFIKLTKIYQENIKKRIKEPKLKSLLIETPLM